MPPEVASIQARREELAKILAVLQAADEAKRHDGKDPKKSPSQRAKADLDAPVLPNKEGGYAANYTPMAGTDTAGDFIVHCDVVAGPNEHVATLPAVDQIEADFGRKPEAFLADAAHGTGENLAGMEEREVTFYTPLESPSPEEGNPAKRGDPRQAVPEADWTKLPRNRDKKLDKTCFVYDPEADCYYCPMGRSLPREQLKRDKGREPRTVYRCKHWEDCPLAGDCRDQKSQRGRSLSRDSYEPLREQMAQRMKSAEAQAVYPKRMHTAETPFAYIKGVIGVRQFLLRGLEKVKLEWTWVCTAYNVVRLLSDVGKLRAALASMAVQGAI